MYGIAFEWDRKKDLANLRKHGVGFAEASSVFKDPLSITVPDSDHAFDEERFVIVGMSHNRSLLVVVHTVRGKRIRVISARSATKMKNVTTKKASSKSPTGAMKAEYDFSGGVRGKYADRYGRGVNVVILDPELAAAFPDSKSVNDALRALVAIATRTDRHK